MKRMSLKFFSVISAICLVMSIMPITVIASQDTWDPENGVFDITTENGLFEFKESLDKCTQNSLYYYEDITVNLLSDITISNGRTYVSPDSNGSAEAQFCGTFNGNNHTISNLNMVSSDNYTVSFLPFLGNATIKDLTLKDVKIENGYTWNAPFAPVSLGDDKIINCHLEGDCIIQAGSNYANNWNYNAGMVADNYMGSLVVENCTVGDNVVINGRGSSSNSNKYRIAAGIVAYSRDSSYTDIKNCINRGAVSSDYIAAGIMGSFSNSARNSSSLNYGAIVECYNYGNISSNSSANNLHTIAGILAEASNYSPVVINKCANFGNVTASSYSLNGTGGISAELRCASIINCYNTGTITAYSSNSVGGIVAHTRTNTYGSPIRGSIDIGDFYYPQQYNAVTNCYNVGTVRTTNGDKTAGPTGGIVGICQESDTQSGHSEINNVYNFGTVSANETDSSYGPALVGTITADTDIIVKNGYAANETKAVNYLHNSSGNASTYTCEVGYYSSAGRGGNVYPATVTSVGNPVTDTYDTISDTALSTDLKETLDAFVDSVNPEFEVASGQKFYLLPWTYSDGSDGLEIHPVFGFDVTVETDEANKDTNGGYVTASDYDVEYEKASESQTVTLTVHPNKGSVLERISATDSDGQTVTLTPAGENLYTLDMPLSDITVKAEFSTNDEPYNAYYLTADKEIDLNFLIDTDYYDAEDGYLKYEYIQTIYYENAERTNEPVTVSVDSLTKHISDDNYDGTTRLQLEAAPAQIGEKYLIEVYDKNDVKKAEFTRSVEDYCNETIEHYNKNPESVDIKYVKLSEAILNYGQLANEYFEYAEKHKAINGVDDYTITTIGDYQRAFSQDELNDINNNAVAELENNGKAKIAGVSYIAQLWPEFRFYLTGVTEEEAKKMNISVTGGLNAQLEKVDDSLIVSITGLSSNEFKKVFTVTIGDTVITYNGYAYIASVTKYDSNEKLKAMIRGVYRYAKASENAFGIA